jgi:hypothetical protein
MGKVWPTEKVTWCVCVWDSGKWHYIADVRDDAIVLTDDLSKAIKYKDELSAKADACYVPEELMCKVLSTTVKQ